MNYVWRKVMGASYQDMLDTPTHIISRDLEMHSMENEYSKPKEEE